MDGSGYSVTNLKAYANTQADIFGIPRDFFANLINAESGWNPNAVSPKGAEGIAQLMPSTASQINRFDPYASITYAAQLLKQYYDRFGSWSLAAAAYNAGPGAVAKYGGVPPYSETQLYVNKIMSGTPSLAASASGPISVGQTVSPKTGVNMGSMKVVFWAAAVILLVIVFRSVVR